MSKEGMEHLLQELEKHTPEQRAEYVKILTGSVAAAPTTISQVTDKDSERQRKWFDSGVRARKNFAAYNDIVSPFYENATADYFFKCGYDGVSFVEAQSALKEKLEQILKQDSTVLEAVKELQTETNNAG